MRLAARINAHGDPILPHGRPLCPLLFSKLNGLAVFSGPLLLDTRDQLDGENVLPGFSYPVAAVFADPLA